MPLVVNLESVFYQVLGLSLYTERDYALSFPRRFKVFSLAVGTTWLVTFTVAVIVLNLNPETQLYVLYEVIHGNIDTIVAASFINWLVDVFSATSLYCAALLTQDTFVSIVNRANAIQSGLPAEFRNKRKPTLLTVNMFISLISMLIDTSINK